MHAQIYTSHVRAFFKKDVNAILVDFDMSIFCDTEFKKIREFNGEKWVLNAIQVYISKKK